MDKYYRTIYIFLHIYKKYHVSYRYFKKVSIKRFNAYKKSLNEAYEYVEFIDHGEYKNYILRKKV